MGPRGQGDEDELSGFSSLVASIPTWPRKLVRSRMGAIDSRKRVVKVWNSRPVANHRKRVIKRKNSHTAAISKLVTSAGQSLLGGP